MKRIKRREFIRAATWAGIGGSLITTNLLKAHDNPLSRHRGSSAASKKIIVAGAGISGLCCAYELMKMGHEVLVLEATGRHGGHVFTGRDGLSDGLYADYG